MSKAKVLCVFKTEQSLTRHIDVWNVEGVGFNKYTRIIDNDDMQVHYRVFDDRDKFKGMKFDYVMVEDANFSDDELFFLQSLHQHYL